MSSHALGLRSLTIALTLCALIPAGAVASPNDPRPPGTRDPGPADLRGGRPAGTGEGLFTALLGVSALGSAFLVWTGARFRLRDAA